MRPNFRVGATVCALLSLALSLDEAHASSIATTPTTNTEPVPAFSSSSASSDPVTISSTEPSSTSSAIPTTASGSNTTPATSSAPSTATCQSKTINYITHTLPQQCLRSRTESASVSAPGAGSVDGTAAVAESTSEEAHTSISTATTESPPIPTSETTTIYASSDSAVSPLPEVETDTDSPLDNVNFLSFEDWKKQNLEKAGQSPDHVGQGRAAASGAASGRKRPDVGSLESLGEEGEIDFDFGGFVGMEKPPELPSSGSASNEAPPPHAGETSEAAQIPTYMRSRDAGKTCKERYNYASFDCAATVLKSNARCKSSTSVLVENKDSYMLNECAIENKFLIVELCDDIIVDTVVLANFEFFSSMVRTFRVSVSDRYPPKPGQWIELGTFEARNSREIQAFLVEGPRVWARYLRIEFLTHYGNEYYCPVSLLRVHGITMMEEYKHEEERSRGEMEQEEQGIEEAAGGSEKVVTADAVVLQAAASASAGSTTQPPESESVAEQGSTSTASDAEKPDATHSEAASTTTPILDASTLSAVSEKIGSIQDSVRSASKDTASEITDTNERSSHSTSSDVPRMSPSIGTGESSMTSSETSTKPTANATLAVGTQQMRNDSVHANANVTTPVTSTIRNASESTPSTLNGNQTANATTTVSSTAPEKSKQSAVAVHPPAPSPSTQESFFKSVDKRLKALESNASLSLQYIEEQSRILRDAFTKVEKRQLNKTATFLDHLNNTVMSELRLFRTQYDQLWQSTVIELETHREQHQREMVAISSRLTLLADEVVFQKRMAVVQSTLLMLCLGFVLFVRSGSSSLELPLMQNVLSSKGAKPTMTIPFESPPDSPGRSGSPVSGPQSERKSGLARFFSRPGSRGNGSPASIRNPILEVSAPTPVERSPDSERLLRRDQSEESLVDEDLHRSPTDSGDETDPSEAADDSGIEDDVQHNRPKPRHVRSGPATPQGTRDKPLDWEPAPSDLTNGDIPQDLEDVVLASSDGEHDG